MKVFKKIILTVLGVILLLVVYGTAFEPRFLLDEQVSKAEIPNLPTDWEGKKIGLLADFQVGMWWDNIGMVKKAIAHVAEQDIDVVLIAGDFVYKPDSAIVKKAVSLLKPITAAGKPVYAVLGNHDYSLMKKESEVNLEIASYLIEELKAAGVIVLENQVANLSKNGKEPFYLVGIGSLWAGKSNYRNVFSKISINEPRIVFMHNPADYRNFPAYNSPLTLAAHTHGGQIRLPLLPSESWLNIARKREVIADGWASEKFDAKGNRLYVSRGIGFSLLPVRIFCRPELSIFEIAKAEGYMPDKEPGMAE